MILRLSVKMKGKIRSCLESPISLFPKLGRIWTWCIYIRPNLDKGDIRYNPSRTKKG